MATKNSWLIENRVLLTEFSDDVSLEDLQLYSLDMMKYLEMSVLPVHIICEVTKVTRYPSNVAAITRLTRKYLTHSNMGWSVVVGIQNPFLAFIADILTNASQAKLKKASSIAQALNMLQQIDSSLASGPINTTG